MKKITVIQMNSRDDKAANLKKVEALIRSAWEADKADYILTPEHTLFLGGSPADYFAAAEDLDEGESFKRLSALAVELGTTIHMGSSVTRFGDKCRNTALIFAPDGQRLAHYHKIHCFDVDLPDGVQYRESDSVEAGDEVVTFDHQGVTVGVSICYDLRFSNLYASLSQQGARVITIPAAFTFTTGEAHWDTLIRARAIETQCYVAAAGQVGSYPTPSGENVTYGNSQIVDPWGRVVARCSDKEGWASAEVDLAYQDKVRQNIPSLRHRKKLG